MTDNHRSVLIQAEQKSQDDYDKTIVSLSGGALGISIIYVKDIIGDAVPTLVPLLLLSWVIWACSIASVLISYYFSRLALRKAIKDYDSNIEAKVTGGVATIVTHFLNAISGILFVLGVIFFVIFAITNLG